MKHSKLKCRVCERQPAVQCYNGLIPVAVVCARCAFQHNLTPVVSYAEPESVPPTQTH